MPESSSRLGDLAPWHRDFPHQMEHLTSLQNKICYTFCDLGWLIEAVTHRSAHAAACWRDAAEKLHYERLEFLGDSLFGVLVAELVMTQLPRAGEGILSRTRARLVSRESLAQIGQLLGLPACLMTSPRASLSQHVIGDCTEAVVGAVYCDGGFAPVRKLVTCLLGAEVRTRAVRVTADLASSDPKTYLQETFQQIFAVTPNYVDSPSPDSLRFGVQVWADGVCLATGIGVTKKAASRDAARRALKILGDPLGWLSHPLLAATKENKA